MRSSVLSRCPCSIIRSIDRTIKPSISQSFSQTISRSFHGSIIQSQDHSQDRPANGQPPFPLPNDPTNKTEHNQSNSSDNHQSNQQSHNQIPKKSNMLTKRQSPFRTILLASVIGMLVGSYYWRQQNNGWPIEVLSLISQANKRLSESNNPSINTEKRAALVSEAESLLKQALKVCHVSDPSTNQSKQQSSQSVFSIPMVIDPLLAPHICMKLGEVCMKEGQLIDQSTNQSNKKSKNQTNNEKYKAAEQYLLHSLRLLVGEAEQNHRVEQLAAKRDQRFNKQSSTPSANQSKPIYDPRVILTGIQLGDLYHLMGDNQASQSILLRCLQITEDMIARNQSINQSHNPNIKRVSDKDTKSSGQSSVPSECDLSEDEVRIVSQDGLSLISEHLSTVFRDQSIFQQSINWAQQALLLNNAAMESNDQLVNQSINQSNDKPMTELEKGLLVDRLFRELNLFTALSNDYYQAAHQSVNRSLNQSKHKMMEMSYAAATHAIETFERLIDCSIDRTSTRKSSIGSSRSPQFIKQSTDQSSNESVKQSADNYIPIAQSQTQPSIHQLIDHQSINQLMKSAPSAQRDSLLVECAAVFANLGSILAAYQSINQTDDHGSDDLKAVFGVAERAARLSGQATIVQTVAQQKQAAINQLTKQ